jgi:hypothetical protein
MPETTWQDKFRYRFDNFMSKGTISLILGLAILSVAIITVVAMVVAGFGIAPEGGDRVTFLEAWWISLMRTLDPGGVSVSLCLSSQ